MDARTLELDFAIAERDDRVETTLRARLAEIRAERDAVREQLLGLDNYEAHILTAARDEKWWQLKGLLSEADIESLCESSPVNLLGE